MNTGFFDAAVVRRHLLALDVALQNLRRHVGRPLADLQKNADEAWIIERGLQLCAQNTLDIATHIAASSGHDVPDYASALDELKRRGILPDGFAARFRAIAGFRNILVHGYLQVDPARLHTFLNSQLDDFTIFATCIERYLTGAPPTGTPKT